MCGIVAVMRRPSDQTPPRTTELLLDMERACALLADPVEINESVVTSLHEATETITTINQRLRGTPGIRCLLENHLCMEKLDERASCIEVRLELIEARIDQPLTMSSAISLEALNVAVVGLRDALWVLRYDRIIRVRAVGRLAGTSRSPQALEIFTSIQTALSALDRLEVRGRDSAGLHVLVSHHDLDLTDPELAEMLTNRRNRLFTSGAVVIPADDQLSFVYKAASEVGKLGDNGSQIRSAIMQDILLHRALDGNRVRAQVLGHTRWASVGLINECNAHPLNQEAGDGTTTPYVVAALNGDVDNHTDIIDRHRLHPPTEITTDAKVIPMLVSQRLQTGISLTEAFRETVDEFEGSVAIATQVAAASGKFLLAQRGSGQSLYVGLSDDQFIVASELYGIAESATSYLRIGGKTCVDANDPDELGQLLLLDEEQAGTLTGIYRLSYRGNELPVRESELQLVEVTTRDIDRGHFPHYFLKEISQSPTSMLKTLRGKIREKGGRLATNLGFEAFPKEIERSLFDKTIRRIYVIGQGTAAVAAMGIASSMDELVGQLLCVTSLSATELSGFRLANDMRDTLVVAISQSGTTTDTNRTVDLVRDRGASVIAIVNRRGSDLTHKAHGILYTSDGRDVEMSVASTKAFYAQIAAGQLLAFAVARAAGCDVVGEHELLSALRELPAAMRQVLGQNEYIGQLARRYAPVRRSWAVVGSGRNRIAAQEIRIKLSELCYKSISCDTTEDKKHIDLSSEPMAIVCAAGLAGSVVDDIAKEIAIFTAHNTLPIVIANEGEHRFQSAAAVIEVPVVHPALAYVLTTLAGHLFAYEAALAIDSLALPLREARASIERIVTTASSAEEQIDRLAIQILPWATQYRTQLSAGLYDGVLDASIALNVATLLRYVEGGVPLYRCELDFGKVAISGRLVDNLTGALITVIDVLRRPIDAIKHQAKTVTVGTSRADESLLTVPLVTEVLRAGADRYRLGYLILRSLVALSPAVAAVTGYTRYQIKGNPEDPTARIQIVDRGGVGQTLASRVETDPRLRGTKQLVAIEQQVLATKGRMDQRAVILIPETKVDEVAGITLLHVQFHDYLQPSKMRRVLEGYRNRLTHLRSLVTETEQVFDESLLGKLTVEELLLGNVDDVADHWQRKSGKTVA